MDVRCRKCGASVAPDIAFCPECGAVMAEAADDSATEKSVQFESTLMPSGEYNKGYAELAPDVKKKAAPEGSQAKPDAAAAERKPSVAPQEKVRSRSSAYVLLGLAAVVLLGALFIYLLSVILSR